MADKWTVEGLGDLGGLVVLVTGANSGVGLETSRTLAGRGAQVLLGCRDEAKGEAAAADIRTTCAYARGEVLHIDVADLGSVERAAAEVHDRHERLDVLVNNAGVMAIPRQESVDGFELQLATNHLGHFALTGRLLDLLLAAKAARVVTVTSGLHSSGRIDFDDLDGARHYDRWAAYAQSKLANVLFAFELQRRVRDNRVALRSLAAHPGWSATNLQAVGPRMAGDERLERLVELGNRFVAQDPASGALSLVRAATDPELPGGVLVAPASPGQLRGAPKKRRAHARAHDPDVAMRLWAVSEERTGVRFDALPRR
jgi:NAD(P)-dependent dehydrogenase (short-subunit alcohol dehydrogenase family)